MIFGMAIATLIERMHAIASRRAEKGGVKKGETKN
jgi:hypothetical protein